MEATAKRPLNFLVVLCMIAILNGCSSFVTEKPVRVNHDQRNENVNAQFQMEQESATPKDNSDPINTALDLDKLAKYDGEFPSVMLKNEAILNERLKRLLKGNFSLFMKNWDVVSEIEVDRGILFATGCRAHLCSDEASMLAIDLRNSNVSVGLLSNSRFRGTVRTFQEEEGTLPKKLYDAVQEMREKAGEFDAPIRSEAIVIVQNANLREYPSSSSTVVKVLPRGTSVTVNEQRGPWFSVVIGNMAHGWLHGNSIRIK